MVIGLAGQLAECRAKAQSWSQPAWLIKCQDYTTAMVIIIIIIIIIIIFYTPGSIDPIIIIIIITYDTSSQYWSLLLSNWVLKVTANY